MVNFLILPGHTPYADAHVLQQELVAQRIDDHIDDVIVLLEHAPVLTVGRTRDAAQNLLSTGDTPIFQVERGGDVTWHGPGQLVAYPILDLHRYRKDSHWYLRALEEVVIRTCDALGAPGCYRSEDHTGASRGAAVYGEARVDDGRDALRDALRAFEAKCDRDDAAQMAALERVREHTRALERGRKVWDRRGMPGVERDWGEAREATTTPSTSSKPPARVRRRDRDPPRKILRSARRRKPPPPSTPPRPSSRRGRSRRRTSRASAGTYASPARARATAPRR